jgi:hypothetical protein
MLVVLFIVSLLAVAALRALPGEDQRPREAARLLSVYIATAKNNAAATGRPAGVILRPCPVSMRNTYARYSMRIEQCEVPPNYSGDTLSAQMMVQDWTIVPNTARTDVVAYCPISTTPPLQYRVVKILLPQSEFPENLLRYGDKIQLGGIPAPANWLRPIRFLRPRDGRINITSKRRTMIRADILHLKKNLNSRRTASGSRIIV